MTDERFTITWNDREIRVVAANAQLLFSADDVREALGMKRDDEKAEAFVNERDLIGLVNESGHEKADQFKDEMFGAKLPELRRAALTKAVEKAFDATYGTPETKFVEIVYVLTNATLAARNRFVIEGCSSVGQLRERVTRCEADYYCCLAMKCEDHVSALTAVESFLRTRENRESGQFEIHFIDLKNALVSLSARLLEEFYARRKFAINAATATPMVPEAIKFL